MSESGASANPGDRTAQICGSIWRHMLDDVPGKAIFRTASRTTSYSPGVGIWYRYVESPEQVYVHTLSARLRANNELKTRRSQTHDQVSLGVAYQWEDSESRPFHHYYYLPRSPLSPSVAVMAYAECFSERRRRRRRPS